MQQFTRNAIIESFLKLLNQYPLNKISIKNIVDDCGINRSTFYYYFEDVYSLLHEALEMETQKIIDIDGKQKFSWMDAFIKSTEFARNNKRAVYHIYNSLNRKWLDEYLYSSLEHMLTIAFHQELEGLQIADTDVGILVDVYKFALVGMIYKWLQSGMNEEFDVIAKRMYELLDDSIRNTLIKTDPRYEVTITVTKKEDSDKTL